MGEERINIYRLMIQYGVHFRGERGGYELAEEAEDKR